MKKVINITIGKIVFYIEEDAYTKLSAYLDAVKDHFKDEAGYEEIMEDIESGIAEKFAARKKSSISISDVESVIKEMGKVKDFEEFEGAEHEKEKVSPKRLYRDGDNAIIAGVASGIAAYLGVDPVIIRLLFAVSIFFGGFGVFLYIVLWIITPVASTTGQKFEMRGEPMNLSNIKGFVEEKFSPENKTRAGQFLNKVFALIGKVIKIAARVLSAIFGAALIIGGVAAIAGLLFVFSNLVFNVDSPYIDISVREIFSGTPYMLPLLAFFLAISIPLAFLVMAGTYFTKLKLKVNSVFLISLLAVWFISLTASGVYAVRYAPVIEEKAGKMEEAASVQQSYDLKDFDSIKVKGWEDVNVTYDEGFSIVATGSEEALNNTKVELSGKTLVIEGNSVSRKCVICFITGKKTEFEITMPKLSSYAADGATETYMSDMKGDDMKISLDGISGLTAYIDTKNLDVEMNGVSKASIYGEGEKIKIKSDGVSRLETDGYSVKDAEVEIDGPGKVTVSASRSLSASINGPGRISYYGNPKIKKDITGPGRIIKMGADSE